MTRLFMLAAGLAAAPVFAAAQEAAIYSGMDRIHPAWAKNGMVVAQEAVAAEVGRDILEAGGNAVDAAVAVAFALAVTLPRAGNLGGGGFMLVHDAASGETKAIDYREMAPAGADRDMFLDDAGEADSEKSRYSGLATGVPGTVAGMKMALDEYGTMSLAEVLAPAIRLASEGITVTADLADSLIALEPRLKQWPASEAIFYKADGAVFAPGDTLVQSDLAATLAAHRRPGRGGVLRGRDRAEDRRRGAGRGRAHQPRRHGELRGGGARPGTWHLPRLRDRLDAAAELGRGPHHPDPEHARRLSDRLARAELRRDHPPDGRGDEARLRGPLRISRRSGLLRRARRRR